MVFENHYKTSRDQRKTERAQGLSDKGTMGFENTGCYRCNGYDKICSSYVSKNILDNLK